MLNTTLQLRAPVGLIDDRDDVVFFTFTQKVRHVQQAGHIDGLEPYAMTLARKIRGVFRFRYRHKSPRVVQVQC